MKDIETEMHCILILITPRASARLAPYYPQVLASPRHLQLHSAVVIELMIPRETLTIDSSSICVFLGLNIPSFST
ncbi:hypothetical protein Hypma_001958 [Hypsizygus marmoreus]|uniref:Uncharacterized protein n=1 Tax=Hypsizygus marmoreus TaxID=39966 RepID=A0A369JEI5_HYPMA|nr:hypothetical protein Hypma_001958 [Hypsizygus marmoreus]